MPDFQKSTISMSLESLGQAALHKGIIQNQGLLEPGGGAVIGAVPGPKRWMAPLNRPSFVRCSTVS